MLSLLRNLFTTCETDSMDQRLENNQEDYQNTAATISISVILAHPKRVLRLVMLLLENIDLGCTATDVV